MEELQTEHVGIYVTSVFQIEDVVSVFAEKMAQRSLKTVKFAGFSPCRAKKCPKIDTALTENDMNTNNELKAAWEFVENTYSFCRRQHRVLHYFGDWQRQ